MQQFSLKRVFASMTAVAIGCAMLAYMAHLLGEPVAFRTPVPLLWCAGGALIGAGLLAPFRWTLVGALLGFLVQLALGYYISTTTHFH